MPEVSAPAGVRPSWLVILTGAATQATIELLAPGPLLARLAGWMLLLTALSLNGLTTWSRWRVRWPVIGLALMAGTPVWLAQGWVVARTYGAGSGVAGALAPALLVAGTVMLRMVLGEERR